MSIDKILDERNTTHGDFETHAKISQELKRILVKYGNGLDDSQMEALSMIFHKAARILNGNPYYKDHWVDIQGYSKLVADNLE